MNLSARNTSSFSEFQIDAPQLARILTYPRFSQEEYSLRLKELKSLGVTSLYTGGRTMLDGIRIAGKGCVGLVIRAKSGKNTYALKVRRLDANRQTMRDEVRLHTIANAAGVGPRLESCTDNFVLMEFIDGQSIVDWASGEITKEDIRSVIHSILEQCYNLDRAGLDHGELSKIDNHVLVHGLKASIIDFESASTIRKTSNVSAAGQSLLVSGAVANMIAKVLPCDRESAIRALKIYKWNQTRVNFENLLALV